eukprot:1152698-Pelagomonas_calceolata.AAC.13
MHPQNQEAANQQAAHLKLECLLHEVLYDIQQRWLALETIAIRAAVTAMVLLFGTTLSSLGATKQLVLRCMDVLSKGLGHVQDRLVRHAQASP